MLLAAEHTLHLLMLGNKTGSRKATQLAQHQGPHLVTEHCQPLLQGQLEPVAAGHAVASVVAARVNNKHEGEHEAVCLVLYNLLMTAHASKKTSRRQCRNNFIAQISYSLAVRMAHHTLNADSHTFMHMFRH